MALSKIFDQLMTTYAKPTLDVMRQKNVNFLAPYNPQEPPELLIKRCANYQEIGITVITKVPYTGYGASLGGPKNL